tara:strand:- start:234 stop:752 length:519 start_codon:yes stop_codon:yes gene_type:complete
MKKFLILLIGLVLLNPEIGFSQDVIENKSLVTLEINSSIKNSESIKIDDSFVQVYIGDKIIRTVHSNNKIGINFDLFLLNEYTLVFSANEYKSKSLDISTVMSVEDVEENKAGWAMPMTLKLEKGNSVDYSLLEPIASVGLGDSGYMEYLSKAIFYYKKGKSKFPAETIKKL